LGKNPKREISGGLLALSEIAKAAMIVLPELLSICGLFAGPDSDTPDAAKVCAAAQRPGARNNVSVFIVTLLVFVYGHMEPPCSIF
jgi:hypothetical protein